LSWIVGLGLATSVVFVVRVEGSPAARSLDLLLLAWDPPAPSPRLAFGALWGRLHSRRVSVRGDSTGVHGSGEQ
jgi:hypothetical protein